MAADKTLDLDIAVITAESRRLAASIKPGSGNWDVIVVGSGAAGGMAAFQLATAGIKVLMLEAGRMLDHKAEYRTMEWPYASPRRGRCPSTTGRSRSPSTAFWTGLTAPIRRWPSTPR
jgi:choline dehydrogenase-like flavoprotein